MRRKFCKGIAVVLVGALLVGCGTLGTAQVKTSTATKLKNIIKVRMDVGNFDFPEMRTFTLTATGDCTLGAIHSHSYDGSFHAYYDQYGESYTGIMTSSSVEGCTLGNNHSSDYGPESLTDTQNALDAAGIVYGYNETVGYYTTEDGLLIAVVSANLLADWRESYMFDGIEEAEAKGADLIIAAVHWGIEGDHYPTNYQQETGHALIDAGADVVIGNHPHVLQGIEEYNGKIICYSLGNFSFGGNKNPSDKNTAIYQQTFTFINGELKEGIAAKIYPCKLSGHSNFNDFQPVIAEGNTAAAIIDKMNQYSSAYSDLSFDIEGNLILTEE